MSPKPEGVVVSMSGGLDSCVALYWALSQFSKVEALTFEYGQRNSAEVFAAQRIARRAGVAHRVIPIGAIGAAIPSALTRQKMPVAEAGGIENLPTTFVPGRNLIFATICAGYAKARNIEGIVLGVSSVDSSGYPDTRPETMNRLESLLEVGLGEPVKLHTPVIGFTKGETILLARRYDGCWQALGESITCYQGHNPGCGTCPSCVIRARGFLDAGEVDPQHVRTA